MVRHLRVNGVRVGGHRQRKCQRGCDGEEGGDLVELRILLGDFECK